MAAMNIEVELDDYTLKKAVAVCEREGISLEGAVAVFVNQIAVEGSIPLNGGMLALRKLGEEAKRNGTANMTLEEINEEIAVDRRGRAERESGANQPTVK